MFKYWPYRPHPNNAEKRRFAWLTSIQTIFANSIYFEHACDPRLLLSLPFNPVWLCTCSLNDSWLTHRSRWVLASWFGSWQPGYGGEAAYPGQGWGIDIVLRKGEARTSHTCCACNLVVSPFFRAPLTNPIQSCFRTGNIRTFAIHLSSEWWLVY